jgi:hypothetical protein
MPMVKSKEVKVSLRQAMREIENVLNENQDRLMPDRNLYQSILHALQDIDQRLIALEQASSSATINVKDANARNPASNDRR